MKDTNGYPIHENAGKTSDYKYGCACGVSFYIQKDLWVHLAREACLKNNLIELKFSPKFGVWVSAFGGEPLFYRVTCDVCGHKLMKNQHMYMFRHSLKHRYGKKGV